MIIVYVPLNEPTRMFLDIREINAEISEFQEVKIVNFYFFKHPFTFGPIFRDLKAMYKTKEV